MAVKPAGFKNVPFLLGCQSRSLFECMGLIRIIGPCMEDLQP